MRIDGRGDDSLRPVSIETGFKRNAEGSVLYRSGNTVVLCVASVDEGVREFMRGRGRGWITAEYLMHPRAGVRRQARDGFNGRPLSGRSHEIARLIGRSLRAGIDARALGERTITVDCDVIEADGGTRTASITGAMVALCVALDGLLRRGAITAPPLVSLVAATSAGIVSEQRLLDLCYDEDSRAEMDVNIVADASGAIVEVQATAEGRPVPRASVDALVNLGLKGVEALVERQREALAAASVDLARLTVPSP